jgi:hypothetical protein
MASQNSERPVPALAEDQPPACRFGGPDTSVFTRDNAVSQARRQAEEAWAKICRGFEVVRKKRRRP